MKKNNIRRVALRRRSRRGIALIIVLGMLSLLMILAVAFCVTMRVERSAAGNYTYTVSSRHVLWAGLGRALNDINSNMTNGVAPKWDILPSSGNGLVSLATDEVLRNIPDSLVNVAKQTKSQWIDLKDVNGVVTRCAYQVINCTGYLDANKVGGRPRGGGTNANEIQIIELSDFGKSQVKTNRFVSDRQSQMRYESLPELKSFNGGIMAANSLFIYSAASMQSYLVPASSVITRKVDISGDAAVLKSKAANIRAAFGSAGISTPEAIETAYLNLLDYVDADSEPQKLDSGATERVPMINEFILHYDVNVTAAGIFTMTCSSETEWAYPFDLTAAGPFQIETEVRFTDSGSSHVNLVPSSQTYPAVTISGPVSYGYESDPSDEDVKSGNISATSNSVVSFDCEFKAVVKLGGVIVDSVPFPYATPGAKVTLKYPTLHAGESFSTQIWTECIDPRFNWDAANVVATMNQWADQDMRDNTYAMPNPHPTPNEPNALTEWLLKDTVTAWGDFDGTNLSEAAHLQVANRPIQGVGELGLLGIRQWESIRLFDHQFATLLTLDSPYHRVLDVFTVSTQAISRGVFNPNSTNIEAIAAVFSGVPMFEYKPPLASFPSAARLSGNKARELATAMIANGAYTNLADVGRIPYSVWKSVVTGRVDGVDGGLSDAAREAPIRNSSELLSPRQNVFVIVLASGASSRMMGVFDQGKIASNWLGYQRAMAIVWRDPWPIPNTGGQHYWFIRYFKMLDD